MAETEKSEVTGGKTRGNLQDKMKKGKTFYKGRFKQIDRDRNPSQWSAYNKAPRIKSKVQHFDPLGSQLSNTRTDGVLSRKTLYTNEDDEKTKQNVDEEYLDAHSTHRILQMSKEMDDDEHDIDINESDLKNNCNNWNNSNNNNGCRSNSNSNSIANKIASNTSNTFEADFRRSASQLTLEEILGDEETEIVNEEKNELQDCGAMGLGLGAAAASANLTAEEEAGLELFLPKSRHEQLSLADIVMKRAQAVETEKMSELGTGAMIFRKIPKQVIVVYKDVGRVLSKWRSGKLPKAFKMIPVLTDWEEILYLTNPDEWTPHAVFQATKMFASQAKPQICQRFYNLVLLPRVRQDIVTTKKLNFHLYQSVRKALFKSQAFMRGFLLPLCMDECRATEALILGGIVAKNSIPIVQSALVIYKLLDLEYSGPVHYFLKVLLNKRYALPMKVVTKLITHFKKFENDARNMPVIWHQTFLVFVQRYKKNLSRQEKIDLKRVLKKQFHAEITPVIRKELFVGNAQVSAMEIDI